MSPIRLIDGQPYRGDMPVVATIARCPDAVLGGDLRCLLRSWADAGLGGVLGSNAEQADAARRAGLLYLHSAASVAPQSAAPLAAEDCTSVSDLDSAWSALLAGQRLLLGDLEHVGPVARLLLTASTPATWSPSGAIEDLVVAEAVNGDRLAYARSGGVVEIEVRAGQSLHWVEISGGEILGVSTPEPHERHVVRGPAAEPLLVFIGAALYARCQIAVDASEDLAWS